MLLPHMPHHVILPRKYLPTTPNHTSYPHLTLLVNMLARRVPRQVRFKVERGIASWFETGKSLFVTEVPVLGQFTFSAEDYIAEAAWVS